MVEAEGEEVLQELVFLELIEVAVEVAVDVL
jgi:hypothetical protein